MRETWAETRRAVSLRDLYTSPKSFHDRDPHVRIAAIHRVRDRLASDERLHDEVVSRLRDSDTLVACFAAVTLAGAGVQSGMEHLIDAIATSEGTLQSDLKRFFVRCTQFPFAVLLGELATVESVSGVAHKRRASFLKELIVLPGKQFYERAREDEPYRERVLSTLSGLNQGTRGLRVRDGRACRWGVILKRPDGAEPGVVCALSTGTFHWFFAEKVVNWSWCEMGRETLFVASRSKASPTADCLYALEDSEPKTDLLSLPLDASKDDPASLAMGVAVRRLEAHGGWSAEMVFADGSRFGRPERKPIPGQLVILNTAGASFTRQAAKLPPPRVHAVAAHGRCGRMVDVVLAAFARVRECELAHIEQVNDTENVVEAVWRGGERTWLSADGARVGQYLLLARCDTPMPCSKCDPSGDAEECPYCQGRSVMQPCGGSGETECPICKGTSCSDCGSTGKCQSCRNGKCSGCNGRRKCLECNGKGQLATRPKSHKKRPVFSTCPACEGTRKCPWCHGTGVCEGCGGRGICSTCHGKASRCNDALCNGRGKIKCPVCDGVGWRVEQVLDCG